MLTIVHFEVLRWPQLNAQKYYICSKNGSAMCHHLVMIRLNMNWFLRPVEVVSYYCMLYATKDSPSLVQPLRSVQAWLKVFDINSVLMTSLATDMIPWLVLASLVSSSQASRPRGIRAEVIFFSHQAKEITHHPFDYSHESQFLIFWRTC